LPKPKREPAFPSVLEVEAFHDTAISRRGTKGYMSRGMVKGSIEWAATAVYQTEPFPTLILKASALMYGFINFHPFADGNKRTALITTSYFLYLNGYRMFIPDDAPEFTRDIAVRCQSNENHSIDDEINTIGKWIQENTYRDFRMRFTDVVHRRSLDREGSAFGRIAALAFWEISNEFWKDEMEDILDEISQ